MAKQIQELKDSLTKDVLAPMEDKLKALQISCASAHDRIDAVAHQYEQDYEADEAPTSPESPLGKRHLDG